MDLKIARMRLEWKLASQTRSNQLAQTDMPEPKSRPSDSLITPGRWMMFIIGVSTYLTVTESGKRLASSFFSEEVVQYLRNWQYV